MGFPRFFLGWMDHDRPFPHPRPSSTFLVPGGRRKVMAHALASELKDDTAPPRIGWERPPEEMGYVAVEDFRRGPWGRRGPRVAVVGGDLTTGNLSSLW